MLRFHERTSRTAGEEGFSLVEVMVAMGVLLFALTGLAYTATNGLTHVAVGRERQVASGLVDRVIEQIRALPYDTVKLGMKTSNLSGDANVSGAGTQSNPYRLVLTNERIPHGNNGNVTPLVPNSSTTTVLGRSFTSTVYVSYLDDNVDSGAFRVTAIVSWASAFGSGATKSVRVQSLLYSPTGCLSTATHPFSAPCQAFWYASAGTTGGQVNTTTDSFYGTPITRGSLDLAGVVSDSQIEQITSLHNLGVGAALTMTTTGPVQIVDHQRAESRADNDPASPNSPPYQTVTAPSAPGNQLTLVASNRTFKIYAGRDDLASSWSAVTANSSNVCANHLGSNQTDNQPCGRATSRQRGILTTTLDDDALGLATLAEITAPSTESLAHTNRDLTQSSYCLGTSGAGCYHARATRYLGRVRIGGIPDEMTAPTGWSGYLIELSGYNDTVTAESGINAAAPTVAATGTIKYWNGTGYTTLSVAPGASVNIPVSSVSVTSGSTTVQITGAFATGGTDSSSTSSTCGGSACRKEGQARARSPLSGAFTYKVTVSGSVTLQLETNVDLGTSIAQASYTEPPSA